MGNVIQAHRHRHYPKIDELQESVRRKCFWALSNANDVLKRNILEQKLGNLADPLYQYLSDDDEVQVDLDEFYKKGLPLLGNSTDIYFKIFQPFEKLLHLCFETAEIELSSDDEPFLQAFIENMKSDGDNLESLAHRKNLICPGLFFSIQSKMFDIFFDRNHVKYDYSSSVLTSAQMYIVYGMLPETVYFCRNKFKPADFDGKEWDVLWACNKKEDITPEIFQRNVFDYEGPTVTIVKNDDDDIYVLANDKQWINSSRKADGSYRMLIRVMPKFERIDGGDGIYCNFKEDSSVQGVVWGSKFLMQPDMRNIKNIEVWGCGVVKEMNMEEIDALQRQNQALEKNQESKSKVPRNKGDFNAKPGSNDWDTDKQLLEMAGYEFDRHRKAGPPPPSNDE